MNPRPQFRGAGLQTRLHWRMVRGIGRWGAAAMLLLALSAPWPAQATATGAPSSQTLTIAETSLPSGLNPLIDPRDSTADITHALFDSLLSADPHDVLVPDLATGYTVSDHGLRYQFTLNPQARWQDGVPVTADDVLFTTRLMRDPKFPAANRFGYGSIASISADGSLTVTITLHSPFAPFLRAFATTPLLPSHVLGLIPSDKLAGYTFFNQHPVTDGPYTLAGITTGATTLAANPAYFGGTPRINQLVYKLEPNESTALADLRSGAVQLVSPSVGTTSSDLLATLRQSGVTAYSSPGYGWTHIDLIESGFLRDHVVRQALTYATPRQTIITKVFHGLVSPADGDQPPTSQYYQPSIADTLGYDPSQIPALLRKHGYALKHGVWGKFGLQLRITLWTDSGCADCETVANLVAASWSAARIPTSVRTENTHKLFGYHGPLYNPDRLYSTQLNAVLYTWTTSPEPDDSFYWSTKMIVRPGNLSGGNFDGFSNATVDRLIGDALTATNDGQRVALYQRIQTLLVEDQPDIFLYWAQHFTLATTALSGYQANPFSPGIAWNLTKWRLG
ncbi:MAG TPA: peptide ABC transporter substrate-binding protein [Chloroflexota bacterium]|nr:peptide ABC transporter substrate-binding protein [Chloroflexota bacterium]